ncbi:hypothetical protein FNF29_04395 [Cafeteria roenbergensis]|uniref:Trichohyalin-plectin-homology domain-containing protein n=1 Tax=Cafeteria roenbergensis TaxID=33653 RepID=A0A5A8CG20_CAFRO|nr:hypothetical protein FNF29_04395 [Cafeteria roenbergensis]|eukprot:KAA0151708.1 hypothetical protein FNF29_04395 [Cafeteria roenbergensis]
MALSGSLSTPSGRAQLERAVADSLRRKFAITPRIRDLVNEEVAAFCAANSRITATQLKGLQLSVAAKVSDDDSADEAGSGDDHVSVESEEDSEGEGETRVVRYGRCALRTHLHRRGDEPTRKRLGRVERAVVRDPNPEVVEGIVTEALMKRKAKEDAARLKARQEEFRTLLKQQEEEKKLAAALDADEDERFGEMLRKQAAHLEAREKEAAERAKAAAREELQARIKTAERVAAVRRQEEAERVAAEKAAIEASIAADEAEKEEERRAAEAARRRIKDQIAENESFNAARKQAEREERERDRMEMDSYARAMREQEEARRRNFAKAFGTPAEYHTEGERLREEAAARDKAEKRRERKEHADRMAKLAAMEKEAEEERREKAAANRADLLRQMAEKEAAKEAEARVGAEQLRMLRMRARREEGEEAAERLEEKRKALALRQALDKQIAIDDDIERSRREAEKLAVAAQVYGIADDKALLSEVAKQLRGRRREARAEGTAPASTGARRINRVGVRTSTRLVAPAPTGSSGLGVSGTRLSARVG